MAATKIFRPLPINLAKAVQEFYRENDKPSLKTTLKKMRLYEGIHMFVGRGTQPHDGADFP